MTSLFEVVDPPTFQFGNELSVKVTQLPHVIVSTVRLSIDHGHGGTSLWYETMVFPHNGAEVTAWGELDSDRYTTEDEARAGHEVIVSRWQNRAEVRSVWEDGDV